MENEKVQKTSRVSKWKVALATLAIGVVMVVPASANTTTTSVEVQGGDYTLGLSESGAMLPVPYNLSAAETTTGQLAVYVDDNRGTLDGWTVSVAAGDFVHTVDGTQTIAPTNFKLTSQAWGAAGTGTQAEVDLTDVSASAATNPTPSIDAAVQIASAAANGGAGVFNWNVNTELTVPAAKLAGTYTSTVTLTTNVDSFVAQV